MSTDNGTARDTAADRLVPGQRTARRLSPLVAPHPVVTERTTMNMDVTQIKDDLAKAKAMLSNLINNGMETWTITNDVRKHVSELQSKLDVACKGLEIQAKQMLLESQTKQLLADQRRGSEVASVAPPVVIDQKANTMIDFETLLRLPLDNFGQQSVIDRVVTARQYCRLNSGLEAVSPNVVSQWRNELRRLAPSDLNKILAEVYEASGISLVGVQQPNDLVEASVVAGPVAGQMTDADWAKSVIGSRKLNKERLLELCKERPAFENYLRSCVFTSKWGLPEKRFHHLVKVLTGVTATEALTDRLVNDYDLMVKLMSKCDGINGYHMNALSVRARGILGLPSGHERLDARRVLYELNKLRIANGKTELTLKYE